jgi:hypothetical protein
MGLIVRLVFMYQWFGFWWIEEDDEEEDWDSAKNSPEKASKRVVNSGGSLPEFTGQLVNF